MTPTLPETVLIFAVGAALCIILFEIVVRVIRFARKLNEFLLEIEEEQGMPVKRPEKRRKP